MEIFRGSKIPMPLKDMRGAIQYRLIGKKELVYPCRRTDPKGLPLSGNTPSSAWPARDLNSCHPDQGALTNGLASRLRLSGSRHASLHTALLYLVTSARRLDL